jgi:RNA polymerase sigma factor (sigma-70 family)
MAAQQLPTVLHYLRRLVSVANAGGLADNQLLSRFVANRDDAAFEVLIWRHGTMVLNLCRRVLGNEHDAEDAFQATFLTLARKAGSIGRRQAVGSWLYKVAYRIALAARAKSVRRMAREQPLGELPAPERAPDILWDDLRPVIDEEILRLPARYRTPFVLCCLEGRTIDEAALGLGCPRGTIGTRLARAKERLRVRLERRGVTVSAAACAALLAEEASAAGVRLALVTATVKAGILFAANSATGAIAAPVVALTKGELQAMFVANFKKITGLVLFIGIIAGSTSGIVYKTLNAGQAPADAREATSSAKSQVGSSAQGSSSNPVDQSQPSSDSELKKALLELDEAEFRFESANRKQTVAAKTYETAQKIAATSNNVVHNQALSEREKLIDRLTSDRSYGEWVEAYNLTKAAERARNAALVRILETEKRVKPDRSLQSLHWVISKGQGEGPASRRVLSAKTNALLSSLCDEKGAPPFQFLAGEQLSLEDMTVASDVEIVAKGNIKLRDLSPGTLVTLQFAQASPVISKITTESPRQFVVKSIDIQDLRDQTVVVTGDGKELRLLLSPRVSVTLNDKSADLRQLKPGMRATFSVEVDGDNLAVKSIWAKD